MPLIFHDKSKPTSSLFNPHSKPLPAPKLITIRKEEEAFPTAKPVNKKQVKETEQDTTKSDILHLATNKPTVAKCREYFKNRLDELKI